MEEAGRARNFGASFKFKEEAFSSYLFSQVPGSEWFTAQVLGPLHTLSLFTLSFLLKLKVESGSQAASPSLAGSGLLILTQFLSVTSFCLQASISQVKEHRQTGGSRPRQGLALYQLPESAGQRLRLQPEWAFPILPAPLYSSGASV